MKPEQPKYALRKAKRIPPGRYPLGIGRSEVTLDPTDWEEFREQAHAALDTMVDYLKNVRERPVWQPIPADVQARLEAPAPEQAQGLATVLGEFRRDVLPYPTGNIHPRFWSWVCGTGSPSGMVADLLASGMNSMSLGFEDSAATRVEMQVIDWFKELFGFPPESSGLSVSGGSMANLVALAVGRTAKCDYDVRACGLNPPGQVPLVAYGSTETHSSVQKALELTGIGSDYYRRIGVNPRFEIDVDALRAQIHADRAAGLKPALLVGTAGTVNTGAFDPLSELADVAEEYGLWFVIDGAFGAIAQLCRERPKGLERLERADALAFDLHKWLHQPYNAGAVLVRHANLHRDTFSIAPDYLDNPGGGVANGPLNFSAYGIQLSRSFASLRVWLTFKTHGVKRFRELTEQNIAQARYLEKLVSNERELEVMAPTALNIVNYRFNPGGLGNGALDDLNQRLLVTMQERGLAAPSSTRLHGRISIRACLCNHRTRREDLDTLVSDTLKIGRELATDG